MIPAAGIRTTRGVERGGSSRRSTLRDVTALMSKLLEQSGVESGHLDAQLIVTHALGLDRLAIYRNPDLPVGPRQLTAIQSLIDRRAAGIPTAYITGTKEFWSLPISVDDRVLIPRPETEILVEEALTAARTLTPDPDILEIGAGSGALSLALAVELVSARIVSTDISADALEVAAANVSVHGLADRISLRHGDLFESVEPGERFTLIVSNPPYLSDEEMDRLSPEVRSEPPGALRGGRDGLSVIERLITGAPDYLDSGGVLVFEIGAGQERAVHKLIDKTGRLVFSRIRKDYAGYPRVVVAQHIHL